MYLVSAVIQFVAYAFVYNLDKKTLATIEHDLGHDKKEA